MMVGLLGIVKRDNAFHDVFRYFGFTVENVVNTVKSLFQDDRIIKEININEELI